MTKDISLKEQHRRGYELLHRWNDYIHNPRRSVAVPFPDGVHGTGTCSISGTATFAVGFSGPGGAQVPNNYVNSKNCIQVYRPAAASRLQTYTLAALSRPILENSDAQDPEFATNFNYNVLQTQAGQVFDQITAQRPSFCRVRIEPVGVPTGSQGSMYLAFPGSNEGQYNSSNSRTWCTFERYFGESDNALHQTIQGVGTISPLSGATHIISLAELYQRGGVEYTFVDEIEVSKIFRDCSVSEGGADTLHEVEGPTAGATTSRRCLMAWFDCSNTTDRIRVDVTWGWDVKYRTHNNGAPTMMHQQLPPHIPSPHIQKVKEAVNQIHLANPTAPQASKASKVAMVIDEAYNIEQQAVRSAKSAAQAASKYGPVATTVAGVAGALYGAYEGFEGARASNSPSGKSPRSRRKTNPSTPY